MTLVVRSERENRGGGGHVQSRAQPQGHLDSVYIVKCIVETTHVVEGGVVALDERRHRLCVDMSDEAVQTSRPQILAGLLRDSVVADIQRRQRPDGRKYIRGRTEGYSCTYWHLGRKAASMMAPEASKVFPLKSASVMELSMVTGLLYLSSPLKVNFTNALMADTILARWDTRYSRRLCTYLHLGIAAARALMPVMSDIQYPSASS